LRGNDLGYVLVLVQGTPALDTLWDLLRSCWTENTNKRFTPTTVEIVERLEGPSIRARTISFIADWNATFTSRLFSKKSWL
jgi:hypothetical protein